MHSNRDGRERALALLYEAEARGVGADSLLEEQAVASDFARRAVAGVVARQVEIDERIAARSQEWSVARMAAVDRALLRLAVWELMEHAEAPVAVILNEAVELAGEYSTSASKRFVNGILAGVAADLGRS